MNTLKELLKDSIIPIDLMRGYLDTALWSSTDWDTNEPLDSLYSVDDFDEQTIRDQIVDITDFLNQCEKDKLDFEGMEDSTIGHNFWLNRCGHGAGFWDSGLKDGNKISDICKYNRAESAYLGDDQNIYIC
tara:strand:+ start:273 stop:665 length:393 start_codon:yes stop_codon:yes gene_type:complete